MRSRSELPRNVLTLVDASRLRPLHLMALVLYESGKPMTYEEIRDRLREAGVEHSVATLQKAWHGRPLIRKSRDGRLHLDQAERSDWHWVEIVVSDHLASRRPGPAAPAPLVLVPPAQPDDATPLLPEEAAEIVRHAARASFTLRRCLIVLVEGARRPLRVDEAVRELRALGHARVGPDDIARSIRGLPGPLRRDEDGRLVVDAAHPGLPAIRRLARTIARQGAEARRIEEKSRRHLEEWRAREAAERAECQAWYADARKLVLRAVFAGDHLAAAGVLDPDARAFEEFRGAAGLRARLERADIVFGLDPWADLTQLGVAATGRTLVDLSPPNKTRLLDRRGRTHRITPAMLIAATLGISRPLGEDAQLRAQAAGGERGKVRRRLEADLKALWRFYEYGRLHSFVRLRWGFLDEFAWVSWNVGRLPTVREILEQAVREDHPVEVVLGTVPGWTDPWSRARRCRVIEVQRDHAVFEGHDGGVAIGFEEIAAIR